MGNYSISFGGIWLGMMILMEALAIYILVYLVKHMLRSDKEKNAPIYMFDEAFDSGDLIQ